MTLALFSHFYGPTSEAGELATLAALAAQYRAAGYRPVLALGDAFGLDAAALPYAAAFDKVTLYKADGQGDGAETMRALLSEVVTSEPPKAVIALASIASRNWAPQIAAQINAKFIGNAEKITPLAGASDTLAPVMGGLLKKSETIAQAAVLLYTGDALPSDAAPAGAEFGTLPQPKIELLDVTALPDAGGLPLRGAAKVVSGGLGVGSSDNWSIIETFAAATEAAVGASRAAVDMGWVSSSRQVGFSGKKVAPEVYVAVGISGAVQHLAGIVGARKIVAINSDPEAPIFKIADLAIVGDYKGILAAGLAKLGKA